MSLTKKYIEKKYNCSLHKDFGFDDRYKFWRAFSNDEDSNLYAEGWTLSELVEDIENCINKSC